MASFGQSREALTLQSEGASTTSAQFDQKTGIYVRRGVLASLLIAFLCGVFATGLLVYYFSSRGHVPVATGAPEVAEAGRDPGERGAARLPTALRPVHYLVRLRPFLRGDFRIEGFVQIEIEAIEDTASVVLHMVDIVTWNDTVKVVQADVLEGEGLGIRKQEYDRTRQFYILTLSESLQAGNHYLLSMRFQGLLNNQLLGFYRATYKDANGEEKTMGSTQFQALEARRAFPCFDEPGMKAEFTVVLGREERTTSLSNMPLEKTIPMEGSPGWFWDTYKRSVPMSTYLVAFVVSEFASKAYSIDDRIIFKVWARKEALEQTSYALDVGPKMLRFFEDYFSLPYPLPKMDMIALPDFKYGAMENWGLVTYRETAMLYDPRLSSAFFKQRVAAVVAHELAHQWFGNLVTPDWWTGIWLNEGFANFLENVATDKVEPTFDLMGQMLVTDLHVSFDADALESAHAVYTEIRHPDQMKEMSSLIVYGKGASIIRMMNHFLSDDTFRKGLSKYLHEFKYGNVIQNDLWRHLTQQGHADGSLPRSLAVKDIMDTWTLQAGYPVLTVSRDRFGGAILTQERFLSRRNATEPKSAKWWIPINYVSRENPDFSLTAASLWMSNLEEEKKITGLPDPEEWVIFNVQQTGFYRVNYDYDNWAKITDQLLKDHTLVHPLNRAQIVDDVLDLARVGRVPYAIALKLLTYLKKERHYLPWKAALNNMDYLERMLSRVASYGSLRNYILSLLEPLYQDAGFTDSVSEEHLRQFKRAEAIQWACKLKHQDCVQRAIRLYSSWMENPKNLSIITANQKSAVYCAAIAEGGEEQWKFAWEQYLDSNVGSEKAMLLSALGCSRQVWILKRYLQWAFTENKGIRRQDTILVFRSVAYNVVGRDLAWNYLVNDWNNVKSYFQSSVSSYGHLIKYASATFNTELDVEELTKFTASHVDDLSKVVRLVNESEEKTRNNIVWLKEKEAAMDRWFELNGYKSLMRTS